MSDDRVRRAAQLAVCAQANSVSDAADLIAMLGLDSDDEHTYTILPGQTRGRSTTAVRHPNQSRRHQP